MSHENGYQSADLLTLFKQWAGRPEADSNAEAAYYNRLAKAQDKVFLYIMSTCPKILYGPPTAMTSDDGGSVWTFGTDDNGYPVFPLGNASLYTSLDAVPNYPLVPGQDYLDEGTQIRMPNNVPWSGTLYWYGAKAPAAITGSVQPTLQPPQARTLIVIQAVMDFAREWLRNPGLIDEMQSRWNQEWPMQITMMRKHFRGLQSVGPLTQGSGYGYGYGAGFGWNGW